MNTYINVLIGLLIGIIIYDMGFFSVIEGLSDAEHGECNKIREIIYKNDASISNIQKKLKSLQEWQSDIVKTEVLNTKRNKVNKENIKRTAKMVKDSLEQKGNEMETAGEGV